MADDPAAKGPEIPPIHPFIYPANLKSPNAGPKASKFFDEALSPYLDDDASPNKKSASELVDSLDTTRRAFLAAMDSKVIEQEAAMGALKEYVAVLLVLVEPAGSALPAGLLAPADVSVDRALDEAEQKLDTKPSAPSSAATTKTLTGTSPLRHAVKFSWNQVLAAKKEATCADAAFELASVLTAGGLWCMARASLLCESTTAGVPAGPAGKAYHLLRLAAGIFDYTASAVAPLCVKTLPAAEAGDCAPDVLRAAACCALADAQGITVLRAITKGNQPALIAALARDTRDQYTEAVKLLKPLAAGGKMTAYCGYKRAAFEVYAQTFNGIVQWKAEKVAIGPGLRSVKEAELAFFQMKKEAAAFDRAESATLGKLHRRFDEELDRVLYDTMRRMEKENAIVHFQKLPAQAAPLPEGRRLVHCGTFGLPARAKVAESAPVEVFQGVPTSAANFDSAQAKLAQQHKEESRAECGGCIMRWLCCCCAAKAVKNAVEDEKIKKDEKNGGNKTEGSETATSAAAAPAKK